MIRERLSSSTVLLLAYTGIVIHRIVLTLSADVNKTGVNFIIFKIISVKIYDFSVWLRTGSNPAILI